jgi:hypothetical protein
MSKTYGLVDIERLGLLDPTNGQIGSNENKLLPQLDTLVGKRIGLFDNSKTNVAALLKRIGDTLVRDHGVAALVVRTKLIYSRIAPPEMIEDLAQNCDAVVTAIGD